MRNRSNFFKQWRGWGLLCTCVCLLGAVYPGHKVYGVPWYGTSMACVKGIIPLLWTPIAAIPGLHKSSLSNLTAIFVNLFTVEKKKTKSFYAAKIVSFIFLRKSPIGTKPTVITTLMQSIHIKKWRKWLIKMALSADFFQIWLFVILTEIWFLRNIGESIQESEEPYALLGV